MSSVTDSHTLRRTTGPLRDCSTAPEGHKIKIFMFYPMQ
jgi:hypothetical protein